MISTLGLVTVKEIYIRNDFTQKHRGIRFELPVRSFLDCLRLKMMFAAETLCCVYIRNHTTVAHWVTSTAAEAARQRGWGQQCKFFMASDSEAMPVEMARVDPSHVVWGSGIGQALRALLEAAAGAGR